MNKISVLNRMFGTSASVSAEIVKDDVDLIALWLEFKATSAKKLELISESKVETLTKRITILISLIDEGLVNIRGEGHLESDIISDLRKLKHEDRIRRLDRLGECLNYESTRYEYAHGLLEELYHSLRKQMHLLNQLKEKRTVGVDYRNLHLLKNEFEVERIIIAKSDKIIGGFHTAFIALASGQKKIQGLTSKERSLQTEMKRQFRDILSGRLKTGCLTEWALAVDDIAMDFIQEMEIGCKVTRLGRVFNGHDANDFEFVNSPEFSSLAKEKIPAGSRSLITEEVFKVFLHVYREWYNHERF